MIHGKTIFRNAATNYLREAVQVLVFLCLMPYIIFHLGVERFGLWSLIWASVYLLGLLDLGLSNSVIKFIADARGRGDGRRLQALTATFFWVYGGVALLIIGLAVTGQPWIAELLRFPQAEAETGARVFLILAIRLAQSLWLGMYKSVLIGYQRQMWVNLVTICEVGVYAILVMSVFSQNPSIETLALLNLGTNLAANIVIMVLCCLRCSGISFLFTRMQWSLIREIMNFSWYFFIVQAALLIYGRVDTLIIHGFLSLSAVALYSVAQRIPEKAGAFCRQLTNALTPLFAELHGSGEQAKIRSAYMLGSKLSVAMATPVLGGLFWFMEDIVRLWIGPDFTASVPACRILLGAVYISVVHANGATALTMTGYQRFVAGYFLGGQLVNVALTLFLVQTYGLTGVAWATFIATALVEILVVQPRIKKLLQIPCLRFYREAVFPSLPGFIVMMALFLVADTMIHPSSLWTLGLLECLGCIVFALSFVMTGTTLAERQYYWSKRPRWNGKWSMSAKTAEIQ